MAKEHIIINQDRSIQVPVSLKKIGVQFDHNVNTLTFDCPRYFNDVDLSTMSIYINYILADKTPGSYKAINVAVDTLNTNTIHFDWTISREVTKTFGVLSSLVCAKKTDEAGQEILHWNSEIFRLLSVSEGMENSPTIESKYPDVITQLNQKMTEVDKKLLDFSGVSTKITNLEKSLETKVDKNQGTANAGKTMSIGVDGNIVPAYPKTFSYDSTTKNIKYGSSDTIPLSEGITLDPTLTKTGFAADAKAVGDRLNNTDTELITVKDSLNGLGNETAQLKEDLNSVNKDCFKIKNSIFTDKIEEQYFCKSENKTIGYISSTFSGWQTKWVAPKNMLIHDITFCIKGRKDQTKNVSKVRVRIANGDIFNVNNLLFDKTINVSVNSSLEETKDVTVNVEDIKFLEGQEINIFIQADAICVFMFSQGDNDYIGKPYAYSTDGSLEDPPLATRDGGAMRLWIKAGISCSVIKTNTITSNNIIDYAITETKVADKSISYAKQKFIEKKCKNNIFDVKSMYDNHGSWYWQYNNKVTLETNQYTKAYSTITIPVDDTNNKVIFSNSDFYIKAWFFAKNDNTIISSSGITAIDIKSNKLMLDIPKNSTKLMMSVVTDRKINDTMVNYGTVALPFENYINSYVINEDRIAMESQIEHILQSSRKLILKLPKKYDLIVDDNFELFYKGITNCLDSNIYDYELTFEDSVNRGKAWDRKWEWTPAIQDVGTHKLNIKVIDNYGNIIDTGFVNIIVSNKPTEPTSEKTVLCIGDSLTNAGEWCAELRRRMIATDGNPKGYSLNNIKFIGTKLTSDGCNYEGYGGWAFDSYLTSMKSNNFMNISGTFDKTVSDQHSTYKDSNGTLWKLETITPTKIKIIKLNYNNNVLPASGNLTWISGGVNHADIIYTSSEQASGNPFWNDTTAKNDFKAYATKMSANQIDHAIILLGWNSTFETEITYKDKANRFINGLLADFPNCKITLLGLQVPSRNGFANNYGVSWKYYDKLQCVWNFNKWYQDIADINPNVEFVNIAGQFDTENCMPSMQESTNNRVANKITVQSNGVHPATSGYYQIADAVLRSICSRL